MTTPRFKDFVLLKEAKEEIPTLTLPKGFIPPPKMRPVIRAFNNSGNITLMKDTSGKHVTLPKKTVFLVGGPVRDFIAGKTPKDFDLATPATPEQIGMILTAAGFKWAGDRSGKGGEPLNVPQRFEDGDGNPIHLQPATSADRMFWFIKGRDNSKERKPFVISAVVDGEEFEIATFRKDAAMDNGQAAVDFVDNPKDDADRRDLTINALYIPLTKDNGENKTVYDPTQTGHADIKSGVVKTVGKAEDRFEEDPLRVLRAIRFHCRFGQGDKLHPDIERAIPKFLNLRERVAGERIRDEFLKGLLHPEVDPTKYLKLYTETGLIRTVFPGVRINLSVPPKFRDKRDRILALAWLLQDNDEAKVSQVLGPQHKVGSENKPSGWQAQERSAVLFLHRLRGFNEDEVYQFMKNRQGTGLSNEQIKDWVDMFGGTPGGSHPKPIWAHKVKTFADHTPGVSWDHAVAGGHDVCPLCHGTPMSPPCPRCRGTGKIPDRERGAVVARLEADRFKGKLSER